MTCTGTDSDSDAGCIIKRKVLKTQTWNQRGTHARIIYRITISGPITSDFQYCFVICQKMWTTGLVCLDLASSMCYWEQSSSAYLQLSYSTPAFQNWKVLSIFHLCLSSQHQVMQQKPSYNCETNSTQATEAAKFLYGTRRVRLPLWQAEHFWFSVNEVKNLKKIR